MVYHNHLDLQSHCCVFFSRLKLEERRKELLQKLEETTKLTTYLHSQLKRYSSLVLEGKCFLDYIQLCFRSSLITSLLMFSCLKEKKIVMAVQLKLG